MITERTLTKWRKESLDYISSLNHPSIYATTEHADLITQLNERILRMTQELLDQHLMRKVSK